MAERVKSDGLTSVMRQMQYLANSGQRDALNEYCRELLRGYGRNNEALMRLARFCQKQQWYDGFELFMSRLADRLPQSRAGIYGAVGQELIKHGRRRGLDYIRRACEAALEGEGQNEDVLERAVDLAVPALSGRDDWEDAVRKFPEPVQARLFFALAERWGLDAPDRAFRAYQRGFHLQSDAWPGDEFAHVALAHARRLVASDPGKAMRDLLWAGGRVDDPRLESEAAAIAAETGDKAEALRLSRIVFQRKPDDLDNLGRLAALQAEQNAWGDVAALAPTIVWAVSRLNPWQRDDYAPAVDLALEAWLRTGNVEQAERALEEVGLGDEWQAAWRSRLDREGRP